MKHVKFATIFFGLSLALTASAEVTEQEIIEAQTSSTLASADYVRKKCPKLEIDEDALKELLTRVGKPADTLRQSEEYIEQRDVLLRMEKTPQAPLICTVLPLAHGGYGRGIIDEK
ncbi:MAG: hypothetical protein V4805_05530 [Pseudomonadota bacterium]